MTGNTVVDAVLEIAARPYDWSAGPLAAIPPDRRLVLITAHRRESFGEPFRDLCRAIRELAEQFDGDGVHFVYPVHLNPNVRRPVLDLLSGRPNISLIEPLDYASMVHLMQRVGPDPDRLGRHPGGGAQPGSPGPGHARYDRAPRGDRGGPGPPRRHEPGVASSRRRRRRCVRPAPEGAEAPRANPYGDGRAAERIASLLLQDTSR